MKKQLIMILALSVCFALASCGTDKEDSSEKLFVPWDNLGGGGTASSTEISDKTANDYSPESYVAVSAEQRETGTENAVSVDLSALASDNAPEGTAYEKGKLTISTSGVYVLSGKLNGCVCVEDTDGTVRLVLDGAEISSTEEQTSAALVFKQTDSLRILTVAESTTNILSDSVGDTDAEGDGAALQAKKCSLTINGGGKLVLNGIGESAAGLKVKKQLTVLGTSLEISAVKNGIKADKKILFFDADVTVTAGNDGIKTDMEASNEAEAAEYAADPEAGYIYVENSSFDITAGDDGFSANNGMYFANTDRNTVRIQTNGGAPSRITETSSDNANGKALKTDGITLTEGETETDVPASYVENYSLIIAGGKFELDSNDDAIHSKGNLFVTGGEISIAAGDDGLHAEYLTKITGGKIDIVRSYEGIEGAVVEITDGDVSVVATDDGINAANSELKNYNFYIYINGGNIFVDAEGDGVDSNGTITIDGGRLIVYGPTGSGDASLDSEKGVSVNGGELLAVGSSGMVENPASGSEQCYISLTLPSRQSAGTEICIYDSENNLLFSAAPTKVYQSVIVSLSAFEKGKSYTVMVGGTAYTATLNATGTALGSNQTGGGNQGFNPGWGGPGGRR